MSTTPAQVVTVNVVGTEAFKTALELLARAYVRFKDINTEPDAHWFHDLQKLVNDPDPRGDGR
jgi:hypothetical protein